MLRFLLLTALLVGSYAGNTRIINGTDAEQGEFPFVAALRIATALNCGSTILNRRFILTAAHCVCAINPSIELLSFQYGYTTLPRNESRVAQALTYTCHPNFYITLNDVAVVELTEDLPEDGSWEPVTLAEEFDGSVQHSGQIVGWGLTDFQDQTSYADTLQKLNVTSYTDDNCAHYGVPQQVVCLGSPYGSACNGDSGTAFVVDGVQAGITSYGTTDDCSGDPEGQRPNGYTKVSNYIDFIVSIAGEVKVKKI